MDLGPAEIIYTWQAMLLAVGVSGVTSASKRAANILMGSKSKRKQNPWITELLLPAVPILTGTLAAIVVPIRPEILLDYVNAMQVKHIDLKPWVVYGAWGAAVGQFSDYLYQRANRLLVAMAPVLSRAATTPTTPPTAD